MTNIIGTLINDIGVFIQQYFLQPVAEHSGYNLVNTLVYAVMALIAAYVIYTLFKKRFTKEFILYTIPFILLGSTVRVVTDSIYSGVMQQHSAALFGLLGRVVNSGIYNYGPFTVTPGIYIVIAAITIAALLISSYLKKPKLYPAIGLVLWAPNFILLMPMMVNWIYAAMVLAIVFVFYMLSAMVLSRYKIKNMQSSLTVISHALDGAASFVAIEIFNRTSPACLQQGICYFGQHVVERYFGDLIAYGTGIYLLIKIVFAILASWVIERESSNEYEKNFIYLLVIIFGLAPGIRNILRLTVGA